MRDEDGGMFIIGLIEMHALRNVSTVSRQSLSFFVLVLTGVEDDELG